MRKITFQSIIVSFVLVSCSAAAADLSQNDTEAAFQSAGFKNHGSYWKSECEDPTPAYSPGNIEVLEDLNDDGLPEVLITEGSSYCYGNTGITSSLVSKQNDGSWKLIFSAVGILSFINSNQASGWPEIEVGGPGFCFPVYRWNGNKFTFNRYEYEMKRCEPN